MVYDAWKNGDPGIIFIDRINQDNHPGVGPSTLILAASNRCSPMSPVISVPSISPI
jgi:ribonucleotide reductase alpha subunit